MTQTIDRLPISAHTAVRLLNLLHEWKTAQEMSNALALGEANDTDNRGAVKNLSGWRTHQEVADRLADKIEDTLNELNSGEFNSGARVQLMWGVASLAQYFVIV